MQIKHLLGCAPLLPMLLATSACALDRREAARALP
jgi:hypothetical protein